VTIGVVTVASDLYAHHLPGWAESVAALTTQPDQIVIGAQTVPVGLPLGTYTYVPLPGQFEFAEWFNRVAEACDTDWIAWCGSDDRYRPHALDGIERDDADVVAFGFQYDTGQVWQPAPFTARDVLGLHSNLVPCGSPIRRSFWMTYPMSSQFGPLSDWQLWAGAAALGARFATTGRIDVDYAYAGHVAPPDEPTRTHISDWLQSL
jgi:hypothetical protein